MQFERLPADATATQQIVEDDKEKKMQIFPFIFN